MKFIPKMSGTRVEDYDIIPLFDNNYFDLKKVAEVVTRQEVMDWILTHVEFNRGSNNNWYGIVDYDTLYKLSILENYPEYEKEMVEHFGDNWMNHYIRFNN